MVSAALPAGGAAGLPAGGQPPIRLMIVDDSAIARAVLSRMILAHKGFEIVALAGNAREALDALQTVEVDIVLLDVEMPGTNGLEALPEILRTGRGARVLIVSSIAEDGAEATLRALALGATDTLPKPGAGAFGGRFSGVLVERLNAIGRARRPDSVAVHKARTSSIGPIRLRAMPGQKLGCLALGASTGGLHALGEFLRALPGEIGAPILITQHLPPVFMSLFARQIEAASGRLTQVAEEGARLRPEQILVAPGDAHLSLVQGKHEVRVQLIQGSAGSGSGCLPSVDPMMEAVGRVYGPGAIGVMLTGMGRDGVCGAASLVEHGGAMLVQDEQTSAVWGMPRAVAEAGLASAVLPPADLAGRVAATAGAIQ